MSAAACSGDPSNCSFCGVSRAPPLYSYDSYVMPEQDNTPANCAKDEVSGCSANPSACTVCSGAGCVATECTGDVKTCKACSGNFQTCRKAQITATEGIERPSKKA